MTKSKIVSYGRLLLLAATLATVIPVGAPSARAAEARAAAALSDVQRIVATEEVRQLKFRWWTAVDNQNWDEVRALFVSPDAKIEIDLTFPDGTPITTAKQFVDFTSGHFYTERWKGIHLGLNPLIDFKSPTEAEVTWIFEAVQWPVADGKPGSAERHAWGHHFDRYIKTPNGWRIASTRFETTTFTKYAPVKRAAVQATIAAPALAENSAQLEANKKLVLESLTALQTANISAAAQHMSDDYIQHNPNVPTGKEGFVKAFTAIAATRPPNTRAPTPPVIVMAENDLVTVVFKRDLPDPNQPGKTYEAFWFDTYRVKDGLLVEHWDAATKTASGAR